MSVWLMENNEGLTVLRLAAALAKPEIFRLVLNLEGIYSQLDEHDGLFDSLLYDVTEIDPVASRRWGPVNQRRQPGNKVVPTRAMGIPAQVQEVGCCPSADTPAPSATRGSIQSSQSFKRKKRTPSVLEIICETGRVQKAFDMLNTYVVRSVIKNKWQSYLKWFVIWAILHILTMTFLTAYAVYKAQLISDLSSTANRTAQDFVKGASIVAVVVAVICLGWEIRRIWRRHPLNLWLIHHNGLYRIELVVFACSLIADSIW